MPSFRCTKKVLDQLGVKPEENIDSDGNDWHVNLIWVDRKKLILFCSVETLFCCVTPPVSKSEIRSLEMVFHDALEQAMRFEGFSQNSIDYSLSIFQDMSIQKTNNRSVLGSMTDYAFHLEYWIEATGGLENCDFGTAMHRLNEIPQVKRDFYNASDAFKKKLIHGIA